MASVMQRERIDSPGSNFKTDPGHLTDVRGVLESGAKHLQGYSPLPGIGSNSAQSRVLPHPELLLQLRAAC